MSKNSFNNRIIRASMLDSNLYEEVEADKSALGQAMAIVVFSSIAAGIGLSKTGGFSGIITGTMALVMGLIFNTSKFPDQNNRKAFSWNLIGNILFLRGF